jgi:hypothetical protein
MRRRARVVNVAMSLHQEIGRAPDIRVIDHAVTVSSC